MNAPLVTLFALIALPLPAASDPMRPPFAHARVATAPAEHEPQLQAVFGSEGDRRAVVDGQVVRAGDALGAVSIDAVLPDGIRYRRGTALRELHLEHASVITKPAAQRPPASTGETGS
jgi:hypothetical protein